MTFILYLKNIKQNYFEVMKQTLSKKSIIIKPVKPNTFLP